VYRVSKEAAASYTLFFHYTEGGSFAEGVNATVSDNQNNSFVYTVSSAESKAVSATISNGVYFTRGCAVAVHEQTVVRRLEPSENFFTGVAALEVTESKVTSSTDPTLFDNAKGSPNYAASGADRYRVTLTLQLLSEIPADSKNYIVALDVKESFVSNRLSTLEPSGSTLEKILAERTFEESGDYTVRGLDPSVQELWGQDSYLGRYSLESELREVLKGEVTQSTPFSEVVERSKDKYVLTLDSGVAYVKGSRIDPEEGVILYGNKARETYSDKNGGSYFSAAITADLGSYVTVTLSGGLPNMDSIGSIFKIKDGPPTAVAPALPGVDIGDCKIQSIESIGGEKYRVYLYDISFDPGKSWSDAETIQATSVVTGFGQATFTIVPEAGKVLQEEAVQSSLFRWTQDAVSAVTRLRVTEKKYYQGTLDSGKTIVTVNDPAVSFDKSPDSVILLKRNGSVYTILSSYTITSGGDASILSITLGTALTTGDEVYLIATVSSDATPRLGKKVLTTENITVGPGALGAEIELSSVYHLVSVNSPDFEISSDGQTPTSYQRAKVRCKKVIAGGTTVSVTHWKFTTPSEGYYYTVDSYVNPDNGRIPLADVPLFRGERLSDYLDARPTPVSTDRLSLDPYSAISADLDFYLPRRDIVIATNTEEFSILRGVPSLLPGYPPVPDNAMPLYQIDLSPYTFDLNDVKITKVNTKRYTMRDIGDLADRVGKLEYYASLSLLEKSAADQGIYTDAGDARFKNGFLVDGFRNHTVGDSSNPEYLCSMDTDSGTLYPYHKGYSVPFKLSSPSSVRVHRKGITLPYTEREVFSQRYATQTVSIQPHAVAAYVGSLSLNPEVDTWEDQTTAPPTNVDDLFSGLTELATNLAERTGLAGTQWSRWKKEKLKFKWSKGTFKGLSRKSTRTGVSTSIVQDDIQESLGSYISDVQIRPWMRSKAVFFRAESLRPNTRFYPFFDGVSVSGYVKAITDGNVLDINRDELDGLDEATLLSKYDIVPSSPSELLSNSSGVLQGVFIIPNNATIKFASGEKSFKLNSSPTNLEDESVSFTSARFVSNGLSIVGGETIITTSPPRIQKTFLNQERIKCWFGDPIAQSFTVEDPTGVFATSLKVYFSGKPEDGNKEGVKAYLVTTQNGYPTQQVVPGTEVSLPIESVVTSVNSSAATEFRFESPVYLSPKTEYALVLFSPNPDYTLYVAEMGGEKRDIITGQIIAGQTATGVFFTSSNASTWTPYQNRDLKMSLSRASFDISTSRSVVASPVIGTGIASVSILQSGGANSGLSSNLTVEIDPPKTLDENSEEVLVPGGIAAEGTPVVDLATGSVVGVRIDKKGFGYTRPPTIRIKNGEGVTVLSSLSNPPALQVNLERFNVGACNLNQNNIILGDFTSVENTLTLDGVRYSVIPGVPIENIKSTLPGGHYITGDNTDKTSLEISLRSSDERLSPFVNTESLSLETREYTFSSGESTSKYVTKKIPLSNPADQIDGYLLINRPSLAANIEVFAQVFDSNGVLILSGAPASGWRTVPANFPSAIPVNSDRSRFEEVRFTLDLGAVQFSSFSIKVVFRGGSYSEVPTVRDLRFIASV
jgi:hypothetical protein